MVFNSPYKQLNRKVNTWCNYTQRLDTYGCGCQHDCSYCYAKSLLSFRGFWNITEPAIADLITIKNAIKQLTPGNVVRIGGMTDCFQPIEREERITYRTILILNQFKIDYLIVTKSDMVAEDEYIKIYDKKLAHFQITVTSTDDKKSIKYEKAPIPSKRIKAIEKLQSLGFDVTLRLSPFLEKNINLSILNNIKCNKILIEFLKVNYNIKKWFDIIYDDYTLKFGGFDHLQLTQKIDLVNKITGFNQVSIGEYVYDHYIYFRDHVNYNKQDCCNLNLSKHQTFTQLKFY
jgi:DNA repair photolyase